VNVLNKLLITGNLGRDSELAYTANSGKAILKFSMAVARGFKKENGTDWFNCALFGDRAEKLAAYLIKGTKVLVEGTVRLNSYEKDGVKKYSTEILVNNVEFIGKKEDNNNTSNDNSGFQTHDDVTPMDDGETPF